MIMNKTMMMLVTKSKVVTIKILMKKIHTGGRLVGHTQMLAFDNRITCAGLFCASSIHSLIITREVLVLTLSIPIVFLDTSQ